MVIICDEIIMWGDKKSSNKNCSNKKKLQWKLFQQILIKKG